MSAQLFGCPVAPGFVGSLGLLVAMSMTPFATTRGPTVEDCGLTSLFSAAA